MLSFNRIARVQHLSAHVAPEPSRHVFRVLIVAAGLNVRMFNDRIRWAAMRRNRSYTTVLAHVIAHEIGHVLLRTSEHSSAIDVASVERCRRRLDIAEPDVLQPLACNRHAQ